MNDLLKQFLLELGRTLVLAALPVILAYLEMISPELAAVIALILKASDRALHETGTTRAIARF